MFPRDKGRHGSDDNHRIHSKPMGQIVFSITDRKNSKRYQKKNGKKKKLLPERKRSK